MAIATTLTSFDVKVVLSWLFEGTIDFGNAKWQPPAISFLQTLADGNAADKAETLWADQRTLTSTAGDSLDLAASLVDAFGNVLTFTKVKGIFIQNTSVVAGDILNIGGGTDDAGAAAMVNWVANASDIVRLGPGGVFFLWNPSLAAYAVTATTADILRVKNTVTNSIVYNIVIVGTDT